MNLHRSQVDYLINLAFKLKRDLNPLVGHADPEKIGSILIQVRDVLENMIEDSLSDPKEK